MQTLSGFEVMVALWLTITDCAIMSAYIGERGHQIRKYGRTFWAHVFGGLSSVIFGAFALALFFIGLPLLATLAAILQGFSIILFAGPFAFPLARYTSGLKGFNMMGYMGYTLAWLYSGVCIVWAPSIETVYIGYVLTHAFLTCRIFVRGFEWAWTKWSGNEPDPAWNYTLATSVAALIPMVLAYGMTGALYYMAVYIPAMLAHFFANTSRWHKRYDPTVD